MRRGRSNGNALAGIGPGLALLVGLGLLLAHADVYAFLTDDAFISFRYARNLAEGFGLVFNPGFERVEGYTNFLWVTLLAGLAALGAAPEDAANPLSIAFTVATFATVVALAVRTAPPRHRALAIALPPLLLAATRSFAVWSTSGLETRLFELLVIGGSLRLLVEFDHLERGATRVRPFAAMLFALACLTRPDGQLVAACAFATAILARPRHIRARLPWIAATAGTLVVAIGAHYLFRRYYYGEWLPNTWYAKVGDRVAWPEGLRYLASFALEYAMPLWIPFLAAGAIQHFRRGTGIVPALFAAICLPHALYVVAVGGDHFEYRPLDLYFPFAYLLLAQGAAYLASSPRAAAASAAALVAIFVGVVELPRQSHLQFARSYLPGFPGMSAIAPSARRFLDPERSPVYRLPGLRSVAAAHRRLVTDLTANFVGVRQEEHRMFLDTVRDEGRLLGELVGFGVLPEDTHIAICCVGAIPYYSGLRTLDRQGLTDARVARSAFVHPEIMAHGKSATLAYARERNVDLWAEDHVHLVLHRSDPELRRILVGRRSMVGIEIGEPAHFAALGGGRYLVAWLPGGIEAGRRRFPRLTFASSDDAEAVRAVLAGDGANRAVN